MCGPLDEAAKDSAGQNNQPWSVEMSGIQSNIKQVMASVKKEHQQQRERARFVTGKMATEARDNVKVNISRPTFPGYAITGALARKVVRSGVVETKAGFEATVMVQQTGKQAKYARIHEHGGQIRAKNKPYLVFKVGGRWRRAKQVTIKPKRYFARGIAKTRQSWGRARLAHEFGVKNFKATIE
jgi:hypothetical protein